MRFKRALAVATASVIAAVGGVAAVALSAGPAAAALTSSVALPFPTYTQMLVDPAHHHLFVTGGSGTSSILVTDYSGQTVATIPNEPGATGLTLSGDGSTVYAALADGDAISAISTSTLTETARYATGTGTDPTYVAYTSGKIWFGYGAPGSHGAIGSVDPAASPATISLSAVNDPQTNWDGAPELKASPAGDLVAGQPATTPLQLASYNVSTGSAAVLTPEVFLTNYAGLAGMQITPDGNDVVVGTGGGTAGAPVSQISSLSIVGNYPSGFFTGAVAIAGDGGTVAAAAGTNSSYQVSLFAPGGTTAWPSPNSASAVPLSATFTPRRPMTRPGWPSTARGTTACATSTPRRTTALGSPSAGSARRWAAGRAMPTSCPPRSGGCLSPTRPLKGPTCRPGASRCLTTWCGTLTSAETGCSAASRQASAGSASPGSTSSTRTTRTSMWSRRSPPPSPPSSSCAPRA
jgi:hypothetical protein